MVGLVLAEKVKNELQRAKELKFKEKFSQALGVLYDLYKTAKKSKEFCVKISFKIIQLCNYIYKYCPNISILHKSEGSIKKYLSIFSKAVPEKHLKEMLKTYNSLAGIHRKNKEVSVTANYFSLSVSFNFNLANSTAGLLEYFAKVYLNISSFLLEQANYQESISFAKESLAVLQQVLKVRQKGHDVSEVTCGLSLAFFLIAMSQEKLRNLTQALRAIEQVIEICKNWKDHKVLQLVLEMQSSISKGSSKTSSSVSENTVKRNVVFFHLDLEQPFTWVKFYSNELKIPASEIDSKDLKKYYTKSKLELRAKIVNNEDKVNFISADEYFFNEITKVIAINGDVKHMKPVVHHDNWEKVRQENIERRTISDLKLKKKYRADSMHSPLPMLMDKLKEMKDSYDQYFKEIKAKMKAVLQSTESKFLIKKLCNKNKKIFPAQRLFFRKIGMRKRYSQLDLGIMDSDRRMSLIQRTKDEIENMMDGVNKEIKELAVDKHLSRKGSMVMASKEYTESGLGLSAYKSVADSDRNLRNIKFAIGGTLSGKKNEDKQGFTSKFFFTDVRDL